MASVYVCLFVKFMCIIGGYNIIGVHNDSVWESVYISYFTALVCDNCPTCVKPLTGTVAFVWSLFKPPGTVIHL